MGSIAKIATAICLFVVALVIMTIILVAISLRQLESKEMGLQYDVVNKDLGSEVYTEGLHSGPPGFKFVIFPNIFKTLNLNKKWCTNKDGVTIKVSMSIQYRVQMAKLRKVVMLFKDIENYDKLMIRVGLASFYQTCSVFNTSEFQSDRGRFESELTTEITNRFDEIFCDVSGVQVNNIDRPKDYEDSIRQKESAKEDIKVADEERPRQETEAETEKMEAEQEAEIILNKAESEARILNQLAEKKAEAIKQQYAKEAEAYEAVMGSSGLAFSPEAFISYMGVRVISDATNPVYIGLDGPAKSSYTN